VDCIFCKIVAKKIPSSLVYEDEKVLAFNDIDPQAPTHILVIPKKHVTSVSELDDIGVVSDLFAVMVNHGKDAGQAVPHLHFHLLGGRALNWPPG
jgi:histidine triad (HIT) family protein